MVVVPEVVTRFFEEEEKKKDLNIFCILAFTFLCTRTCEPNYSTLARLLNPVC